MQLNPPELADADWSIMIRDADTGGVLAEHDAERLLKTASVGKLFLLAEVARQEAQGELDPSERLSWLEEEYLADSGIWYLMAQRELAVSDLCILVGAFSDNLATNVLVRRVGVPAVRRAARDLGCTRSALLDRIREHRGPDDPPTLSVGTAAELSQVMAMLHRGEAFGSQVSEQVLRWIAADADLSMVASAFDLDPLAHAEPDRGITLINKTGTISSARIDVGVVVGPARRVAYAVGANWPQDHDPRDQVLADMRRIGTAIRSLVTGPR